MKIGFVGLGGMGTGMAETLLRQGHTLHVYNRTRARAEPLAAKGAHVADTPAAAARDAEVVISMLADDAAVESATLGDQGILAGLADSATHVSSSTISVALSTRLARLHADAGKGYVAAPVFGRPDAAAAKQLWVLAAGPAARVERCLPALEALGRGLTRLGEDAPQANVVKLAGNFVIASMIETLGEAFALTRKAGIPAATFAEVFGDVFARSPIFEGYAKRMAAEEYEPAGFKMALSLKDVRLMLALGDATAVPLPLASLVRDHLLEGVARGHGDLDWSALAKLAAERSGL